MTGRTNTKNSGSTPVATAGKLYAWWYDGTHGDVAFFTYHDPPLLNVDKCFRSISYNSAPTSPDYGKPTGGVFSNGEIIWVSADGQECRNAEIQHQIDIGWASRGAIRTPQYDITL